MEHGKVREEQYVLVVDTEGVDDGAYRVLERYPDGDARISVRTSSGVFKSIIVPAGQWVECEE